MRLRESSPCSAASARPYTTAQAAAVLGFAEETIIKLADQLGGYRSGTRGHWRFPVANVEAYKGKEAELRKPTATMQSLAREIHNLTSIGIERDNRHKYELEKLELRIAQLEKRLASSPRILEAAA